MSRVPPSPMLRGLDSDVVDERTEPALRAIMRNTATPLPPPVAGEDDLKQHYDDLTPAKEKEAVSYDGVQPADSSSASARDDPYRDGQIRRADDDEGQLKRALHTRHLVFLAIAGIIGPGLLATGSGNALATAGPAGCLIAFAVTGLIGYGVCQCIGEMATVLPVPGAFITWAGRFVDPALGTVSGANYWFLWVCVLANEYVACALLVRFWPAARVVPTGAWIAIFWVVFLAFSMLGVASFGEAEFWLATIKVLFLCVFFILSIVISTGGTGQPAVGFRYYHDPGPFVGTGIQAFNGISQVLVISATLYAGIEATAIVAAESSNPAKAVPRAIRSVFFRILFLYLGFFFFISICVPSNDPRLINATSRAAASPLTIAMERGGIQVAASVINAIIIVSVISAANSSLYICSRTLQTMANRGELPRILAYTTPKGKVPIPALVVSNVFALISFLAVGTSTGEAYRWIINFSGVSSFLCWGTIALTHLRFRAAMKAQNHDPRELPFRTRWWPWGTWFTLIANIVFALVQGYTSFLTPFSLKSFLQAYIVLPVFFLYYFVWKLVFRTKILKAHEIDIDTGRVERVYPHDEEDVDEAGAGKRKGPLGRIAHVFNRAIA